MRLLEAARADGADPRTAIALLQRALGLWRGPGVADVGDEPAVLAEIQQLEWLRLSAVEDLARLRLALGEHELVVPELRRALAETPYNEQLWASLMIALARCGKRAEALIAFQQARAALRVELDIEPGRELQELALRLREGDRVDTVAVARPALRPPSSRCPTPARRRSRPAERPTRARARPRMRDTRRNEPGGPGTAPIGGTDPVAKVTMPQLGESVAEGTIGRWLKQPGDTVAKYEPLLEVITDKVNAEVPSPVRGRPQGDPRAGGRRPSPTTPRSRSSRPRTRPLAGGTERPGRAAPPRRRPRTAPRRGHRRGRARDPAPRAALERPRRLRRAPGAGAAAAPAPPAPGDQRRRGAAPTPDRATATRTPA